MSHAHGDLILLRGVGIDQDLSVGLSSTQQASCVLEQPRSVPANSIRIDRKTWAGSPKMSDSSHPKLPGVPIQKRRPTVLFLHVHVAHDLSRQSMESKIKHRRQICGSRCASLAPLGHLAARSRFCCTMRPLQARCIGTSLELLAIPSSIS